MSLPCHENKPDTQAATPRTAVHKCRSIVGKNWLGSPVNTTTAPTRTKTGTIKIIRSDCFPDVLIAAASAPASLRQARLTAVSRSSTK